VESFDEYASRLASDAPVPGGGSAAAVVAALGAALVAMVARISAANPKYEAHADAARDVVAESDALRERLTTARQRDERAFAAVISAQRLPKASPEERSARGVALEAALRAAAEAPLDAAEMALRVLQLADRILRVPNRNLAGDAGCGAEFAFAALAACAYNVRVNHRYMHDAEAIAAQSELLARYEGDAAAILVRVRAIVGAALARG
jgi:methenyltetrahydrofolate cyclohydrolase